MAKDTIKVYGAGGKKLGEIRAWTGFGDYLGKVRTGMDSLGWMTWDDLEFGDEDIVIKWAWRQVLNSVKDLWNGNMPSRCIVCGEKSVNIVRPSWPRKSKDRFVGVACTNKKCKMYNVLIPAEMFYADKNDVPWDNLG